MQVVFDFIFESRVFWVLVLSLVTPMVVSALKQASFHPFVKVLIALGISLIGGAWTALVTDHWSVDSISELTTAIFTCATAYYHAHFKWTAVNAKLESWGSEHNE